MFTIMPGYIQLSFLKTRHNTSKIYSTYVCLTFLQCIDRLSEEPKILLTIKDEEQNRLNPLKEGKILSEIQIQYYV
jgi:hypothetical protein